MFGKGEFPPVVAFIHAANLWHADMGFIGKHQCVIGNKFKQRGRRFARRAASQIAGIILNAVAHAGRLKHFDIKIGPLLQALGLKQFAVANQLIQALPQLLFNADDSLFNSGFRGHIM